MKLRAAGQPHLTYCTNIHPGESWAEVRANLARYTTAVKAAVAPDVPFGVGLRLSGRAADELAAPGVLDELRAFLATEGLYVFTINGFPHGTFHGTAVKEQVYLPDWLDDRRLSYTDRLATLLAALLPDAVEGSVSTVPGAFKPRVRSSDDAVAMADRMLRHVGTLHALRERTGRTITLALEPEPCCHLETIAETVAFFETHLFSRDATARVAESTGLARAAAADLVRQHLSVCLDACHMAVEFEDVAGALGALARAGIRIGKIQVSAGLDVALTPDTRAALAPFAEGVYLHQVVQRRGDGLERWVDLPDALAAARGAAPREWRIHFHVPLFREHLGPFRNTQPWLRTLLDVVRTTPVSPHLEVETYTWDVLPPEFRQEPIVTAIARELAWVRERLAS